MSDEHGTLISERNIPRDVQLALIKKRTERGMRPRQIATLMGLDLDMVQDAIDENGWTPHRKITKPEAIDRKANKAFEEELALANMIRKLAERNMSRQDVADIIGKSRERMNQIARTHKIPFPHDDIARKERGARRSESALYRSEAFHSDIMKMRAKRMSVRLIAEELGCSEYTIENCIRYFKEGGTP